MTDDESVADILGDWYAKGEVEDPEDVIRAHAELAAPLRAAFAARDVLGRARGSLPATFGGGERSIGEFRIVREIGRGGMGVVYEAEQTSMGRRVALKLLDPAITFSAKGVERFRREARAAGRLHHTNIVPVFAMGEADGVWYYAMEWVRGTTLAQVIAELRRAQGVPDRASSDSAAAAGPGESATGPASAPASSGPLTTGGGRAWYARIATSCAGVADALAAAHAAGVVHRDVKPANLVFDAAGTLKVMDFGLAYVEGEASRTVTGDLLGTPAYMSPEQARGGGVPVDGRTDVYSLGATLYELLTLRPPFGGEDARQICARILSEDPIRPRRLRPGIPRDLETIVLKAIEKDVDRRYRTAEAMAHDLRAFAEGRVIGARPVGWVGRSWRRAVRHKALSALGAVVAMLVVAVGILAVHAAREADFRRRVEAERLGASATSASGVGADWRARAIAAHAASGDPARRVVGAEWVAIAQVPVSSYGLGAAFVGGRLYAISGYFTPRVAVYDPVHDVWGYAAPLSKPLQYFGTAVLDGKIYVVGGDLGGAGASDALHVYDPVTDAWTTRASMPGGSRWDVGVTALDGKLWVLGGKDGATGEPLARVEVYDPVADHWAAGTPMPTPRGLSGGVGAIGGKLLVAGGHTRAGKLTTLEVYDPATDTWSSRASLPKPASAQAAVAGDRLFMVGGGDGDEPVAVYAYDATADVWTPEPSLLWPRRGHGVAYDPDGRRLYAVGGYVRGSLSYVEVCSPSPQSSVKDRPPR